MTDHVNLNQQQKNMMTNIENLESILKSKQQMKEFTKKLQKQMEDASEFGTI